MDNMMPSLPEPNPPEGDWFIRDTYIKQYAQNYAAIVVAERDAEIARLREANAAFVKRQEWWNERMFTLEQERDALRAEVEALRVGRDSLRDSLIKALETLRRVLDTRNKEADAIVSYQVARENFSDSTAERKVQERAMLAASEAEREARALLLTLRTDAARAAGEKT
jgi:uncharacterized coiled-coil DUF342 family protein